MDYEAIAKEMTVFFQNSAAEMRLCLSSALAALEQMEEASEHTAALRRGLYRMLRLTWNLNDFSVATDETPLHLASVCPLVIAEEIFDESAALVEDAGRKLLLAGDERMPAVALNPHATRRILYQLLSNALAVTPEGGTIRLSCRMAGGQVLFSVADEGGGIPPEALDRIFSAPFAGEPDFSPHGLRLGLPLAKLLAEKQGGRLLVETKDGGSCFTFAVGTGHRAEELRELRADYTGGISAPLVELSSVLPRDAYRSED